MAKTLTEILSEKGPKWNLEIVEDSLEPTVYLPLENFLPAMEDLKTEFEFLTDLTAIDEADHMEVIYHLMHLEDCSFLRVKVKLEKDALQIPSLTPLWKAANVQEREVYDLFGIVFSGHPELKRILCADDFEGHPLRKDFLLDTTKREV